MIGALRSDSNGPVTRPRALRAFSGALESFREFGARTRVQPVKIPGVGKLPVYTNEFWTAKQRAAHSLHEVSYRACFKPQLPAFFIDRLTGVGDVVYDPFAGRGTTLLQAALMGRVPYGCDINPLSEKLIGPRLAPPDLDSVELRLRSLKLNARKSVRPELLAFYHSRTLETLTALRAYLLRKESLGSLDAVDRWIWMVALNRLTGHSTGFFSVYTLPPNQAVSVDSQLKINKRLRQRPPKRDVLEIILNKSRSLLRDFERDKDRELLDCGKRAKLFIGSAARTRRIRTGTVKLVVTSPPFLDVVDYVKDNWLRGWFAGVDIESVPVWQYRKLSEWQDGMSKVFSELSRVLVPGGHVAFEVGEVRNGTLQLEEAVAQAGQSAGLQPILVLINQQKFTKTSNCWGIENQKRGTNTNRIVLFRRK